MISSIATTLSGQIAGFYDSVRRRDVDEEVPEYLSRHYWWAYVNPVAIKGWDVSILGYYPLINLVLMGQYDTMVREFIKVYAPGNRVVDCKALHISSAYGHIVPSIAAHTADYTLVDVIGGQLDAARRKLGRQGIDGRCERMNAERLKFGDDTFDRSIVFFLLHELPPDVRARVLSEAIRVVRPGGYLFMAEYNESAKSDTLLFKVPGFRRVSSFLEPFLPGFWQEDLEAKLAAAAAIGGKRIELVESTDVFGAFYRIRAYRII